MEPERIRGSKGLVQCENYSFKTKFIWKVAFNTEKLQTGTTCMSRRFHVQPVTDIEFWFQVSKDCDEGSISFYCNKNDRYPLAARKLPRSIEIEISIDELHETSYKQIIKDDVKVCRIRFSSEAVKVLRPQFSPIWEVLWTFTFRNYEHIKPQWCPPASVTLNDTNEREFPIWNYEPFLKSGEFSDLTLEVSTLEYRVHKCILACRSNIDSELLKSNKIVLKSENIKKDEMDFVLRYMYTGSVKNLGKLHILRIYKVARELDMPSLTDACSKRLIKVFSTENILEMAKFVEPFVDKILLMEITVFIVRNFSEISQTEKWLEFKRECKLATGFERTVHYYECAKVDSHLRPIN